MHVLTVYAHPNPRSFCHALLERFTAGLGEAGHTSEVVDLYAMHFDPVFRPRDFPSFVDPSFPESALERMGLRELVVQNAGGPVRRFLASRLLKGKDLASIARMVRERVPKEIREQQAKLQRAQGLAFVAPVYWLGLPAILKGWFERVFTPGFAFGFKPEAWQSGDVAGRIPLLQHQKALVMSTTFFRREDYEAGLAEPMARTVDAFGLRYPGVKRVEHVYFYGVPVVDDPTRRGYLEQAHQLGIEFAPA
jgi:NAD(P)H dehydrogenase (quinone)